jgi:hypothetical protein
MLTRWPSWSSTATFTQDAFKDHRTFCSEHDNDDPGDAFHYFAALPNAPPDVMLVPFKDFRPHRIQLFSEATGDLDKEDMESLGLVMASKSSKQASHQPVTKILPLCPNVSLITLSILPVILLIILCITALLKSASLSCWFLIEGHTWICETECLLNFNNQVV